MLNYECGKNELKNWIIEDKDFNTEFLGKTETIMALGNGYLGIRSSHEEDYVEQKRNTFIAGTFNKATKNEVTELPNMPDVINFTFYIDGKRFSLEKGAIRNYSKSLNLKNGELVRTFQWISPERKKINFTFKRFISLENNHLVCSKIIVQPLEDISIHLESGINGRLTNSGSMHLNDGMKRIHNKEILSCLVKTNESNIEIGIHAAYRIYKNNKLLKRTPELEIGRRQLSIKHSLGIKKNDRLCIQKISTYHTNRDISFSKKVNFKEYALEEYKKIYKNGYDYHFEESKKLWEDYWDKVKIIIKGEEQFDQLAIRFAQYHLRIMTPTHDERMGIGAKGLTGEGYKGHSFWDTEIFILPYFIYTIPEYARKLLKYRYLGLQGAKQKAISNGYKGAMYPWESAWITDGEVTPVSGAVDIHTGEATKIWSGFIEQHITSDIVYALWLYNEITGDEELMNSYGYEMVFETAIFWSSRLEWNTANNCYCINNIIGPDEYKEHVNNNAFTNYMAKFNIDLAIKYYEKLEESNKELLSLLDEKVNIHDEVDKMKSRVKQLHLPNINDEGIIPQDDSYLTKRIIDLKKYKNHKHVGSIFKDYNLDQVNNIQVSKQADIMMLFYLREELFSKEIMKKNWNYYEPKTLHDSSLSLSIHSIIANDMHDSKLSYELFKRATEIDLGSNMKSSNQGIHAAALGGIWQCIVNGYGGIRYVENQLKIRPKLPELWDYLEFPINIDNERIVVKISKEEISFEMKSQLSFEIEILGSVQKVNNKTVIKL